MATKTKTEKKPARYWAIGNRGGWGEDHDIHGAVKNAIAGGWAGSKKSKLGEGDRVLVWNLDPSLKVTHISDSDGHALHRPEGSKPGPMGRHDDEVHPYEKGPDGKFLKPRTFVYSKGYASDAGANLKEVPTDSFPTDD